MPDRTAENLAIWEGIRDKAESKIAALVERTRASIPKDKSLAQFRTARPVARQFYEILEVRANEWVSEVHRICRDARNNPIDSETKDFRQAVFDFVIEPFIDEQLVDLMLQAAGFKDMECQLAKRGDRDLKAYMPERYASLSARASGCREVKEKVRSKWIQKLSRRRTSLASADTSPTAEPEHKQEFRVSDDGRSIFWNGKHWALTSRQGQAVRILYERYKSGTPDVSDYEILEALGTSNSRLRDTFRNSPLWNTLIISKKKGMHRLDPENVSRVSPRNTRTAPNTR